MNIKGKVLQALPMEGGISRNGNSWQKASLIVETAENPQYPKKIKVSNMKNAEAFLQLAVGTEVTFNVEIESREYNGRWYTEVNCWGWNVEQQTAQPAAAPVQQAPQPQAYQQAPAPIPAAPAPLPPGSDPLPF